MRLELLSPLVHGSPSGGIGYGPGELYETDDGTARRMIEAGQARPAIGEALDRGAKPAKPGLTWRPASVADDERVKAAAAKLTAVSAKLAAADGELATAHEDRALYETTDTLLDDATSILDGKTLRDDSARLDGAVRLAKRRVAALEHLHRQAEREATQARAAAALIVRQSATKELSAIRKRIASHIEGLRVDVADLAELRRRLCECGAGDGDPLSWPDLSILAAGDDADARLREAVLQLGR